jgi:hypothetical protein
MTVGTPTIKILMALGNKPTDASFTFSTDITSDVRHLHYTRGRNMTLNVVEAGTGDMTINDSSRRYDPNNSASPYYPNIVPMKPMQVQATMPDTTLYIPMTQFVERWPRKRTGPHYAERQITTIDGFDLLSLFGLQGRNYGTQLSGALIANILDDASWPSGLRNLAGGQSVIDATGSGGTGFATSDTTKALSFIQQAVGAGGENGIFFIDGKGRATFLDRHSQFGPPFNTSQCTLTDILTTPGEFQYTDIQPSSDKDLIFDDWIGQRSAGSIQEAIDSISIANWGRRSQSFTSILTTDLETQSSAQYLLSIYKNPLQRVQSVTIKPGNNAELWAQCLQREIGDRITVKEHPPGTGGGLLTGPGTLTGGGVTTSAPSGQADIRDYTIQGIDATFDMGPVGSAVFVWSLFPANSTGFILDDPTNGQLDTGPGLGY